ncbi:unnamed protein product [Lepeophtheirus salmonis]|uniref:(salmon louse) hypothetical protein n=1 Tax=Lepeophtheirus salmonis TaxID=72036 RepID=A0A7R8CJ20_LEPSM|nr:unnamed protein product [Lepeophtheirus salmonis]CAF2801124.1 unnamed protein product [Lepeophtheirus salmonis]
MEDIVKGTDTNEDSKGSEDILAALENIPGVGSLRSIRVTSSSSLLSSSKEEESKKNIHPHIEKTQIQALTPRPLPQLPQPEKIEEISLVSKEEDLYDSLLTTSEDGYCELKDIPKTMSNPHNGSGYYLTMTGTVKRGRKRKDVDIHLDLSGTQHLSVLEKRVIRKYHDRCFCGLKRGIHILFLSLFFLPVVWFIRTLQAFFLGTMTWYNIFIHYNEERTCCHKLLSPFVLILYPLWIGPVTILLGLWGGFVQISWYFDSWIQELRNPDSGFFSWFCNKVIDLPDCAPYQVVILPPLEQNQRPSLMCSDHKNNPSMI